MTVTAVVAGSLNVDLITTVDRIPLVGQTRQATAVRRGAGGKGANQAVALARLGATVRMIGYVGDDSDGRALVDQLTAAGVSTRYVTAVASAPTGLAVVMVNSHGDNAIVVIPGANAVLNEAGVSAATPAYDGADLVLVQLESPLAAVRAALSLGSGALRVLNAAPARPLPDDLLALVDVLMVNESEAREIGGSDEVGTAAAALRERGPAGVVVTLGADGALCTDADGTVTAPAFDVRAVDTTGAGDCFVAAFAVALAERRSPLDALRFGNAAAAVAVTRHGAQDAMPTRAEVEAFLAWPRSSSASA